MPDVFVAHENTSCQEDKVKNYLHYWTKLLRFCLADGQSIIFGTERPHVVKGLMFMLMVNILLLSSRCMDLDGDGYLSMYELEYFYEEQLQRMEALGIETLPFHDCLCQVC